MFYQNPYSKEASSVFARNLVREIELWSDKAAMNSHPVHAVYFGGGTPTALEPEDLKTVLTAVNRYLPLANDCEITIEGRIHNFGDDKIEAALEGGANRFSLGVQTFDDRVRQSVMRVDGRDAILSRLDKLISYDEAAVVIDLIYGFLGRRWKFGKTTFVRRKVSSLTAWTATNSTSLRSLLWLNTLPTANCLRLPTRL